MVGIDHPNSWQASRKASVWRDEKIRERKKEAIFFFFRESGPGSQAILRPKKKKKKRNYKESLVTRGAISSGMASSQTCSSLPDLECLARKWATELPRKKQ